MPSMNQLYIVVLSIGVGDIFGPIRQPRDCKTLRLPYWLNAGHRSLPFCVFGLKKSKVCLPFVSDDFAASETADRDDHVGERSNNMNDRSIWRLLNSRLRSFRLKG